MAHLCEEDALVPSLAHYLLQRVDRDAHRVMLVRRGSDVYRDRDRARGLVQVHHADAQQRNERILIILAIVERVRLDEPWAARVHTPRVSSPSRAPSSLRRVAASPRLFLVS